MTLRAYKPFLPFVSCLKTAIYCSIYCSFTVHLNPKDSKYTLSVKNGKTRKYTLSAFIESQVLPIPGLELRHSGEGRPLERLGG